MILRSPGRPFTFFFVIAVAMLIMVSSEWEFILHSSNTQGKVVHAGERSFRVIFIVEQQNYELFGRVSDGIPDLKRGEEKNVRYTLTEQGDLDRAYINWFWEIYKRKILVLVVALIPWFAFVWSMPAKWTLRLGKKRHSHTLLEKPDRKDRPKNKFLN